MLTAVVLLPTIACRAAAVDYEVFRIMTFNICHCATHYSLSVTDEDVRRTASVIAAERPDFVCLQEVDKCTTRSAGIDVTQINAQAIQGKHEPCCDMGQGAFDGFFRFTARHVG